VAWDQKNFNAVIEIAYRDVPLVRDRSLLTCQGTEDLPALMQTLIEEYGKG
jgi:putative intracellular protease/amidase